MHAEGALAFCSLASTCFRNFELDGHNGKLSSVWVSVYVWISRPSPYLRLILILSFFIRSVF